MVLSSSENGLFFRRSESSEARCSEAALPAEEEDRADSEVATWEEEGASEEAGEAPGGEALAADDAGPEGADADAPRSLDARPVDA